MNVIQIDRPKEANKAKALALSPHLQTHLQNSPPKTLQNSLQKKPCWAPHQKICCCYINSTAQFQIIRISDIGADAAADTTHELIERTVLPYSSILFEANSHDYLEVHTGQRMNAIHSDTIPCCQLVHPN